MRAANCTPILLIVPFLSAVGLAQLPSAAGCDRSQSPLADCTSFTQFEPLDEPSRGRETTGLDLNPMVSASSLETTDRDSASVATTSPSPEKEGFHWGRALSESFTFLVIEQAYVVHTDFNWVVAENGIPFNHYWRDYQQSLSNWWRAGWSAGENPLYNYVGHPIQGAMTGYIELQNDPKYEKLEYSNSKAYWRSRLKAMLWNTLYSTQWSIGPVSEMTVEKYGAKARPPWNANGTFPCDTNHCFWGVGKVNLVMTPIGGFGWMLAEDVLDKKIVERVEEHTENRFLIDAVRCSLNPIRGGANILHGRRPWDRVSRDAQTVSLLREEKQAVSTPEAPRTQVLNGGDLFFAYSHTGASNCEVPTSGAAKPCDPLSLKAQLLNGWNTAIERKYSRYLGVVADFSQQYGDVKQREFLFGLRGGAWAGRFRPFAQALFGAVHVGVKDSSPPQSLTTFAEDLGLGIDFRLTRLLSWRTETDAIKTGDPNFERYSIRVSSGLGVRF